MLCKVIPGEHAETQPVIWRRVGAQPLQDDAPQQREVRPPGSGRENAPDVEARLRELESSWQRRAHEQQEAAYREGAAAGKKEAAAELRPLLERVSHSVEELATMRANLRRTAEADLVRLAIAIARRVLHRELTIDPEAVGALVRHALETIGTREKIRIRAHSEIAAAVRSTLEKRNALAAVEIAVDHSLPCGSLFFEMERGGLDASIDTQLEEIERGLADRLGGR
jgi:flagellar assembly protein FliH